MISSLQKETISQKTEAEGRLEKTADLHTYIKLHLLKKNPRISKKSKILKKKIQKFQNSCQRCACFNITY